MSAGSLQLLIRYSCSPFLHPLDLPPRRRYHGPTFWNVSINGVSAILGAVNNLTGNATVLKRVNRVRALNRLRFGGPASRAELARATGLDAKTITNVVGELLGERLVTAGGSNAPGRGRPAERLAINPDAAIGIGVDFGASQVTVAAVDLAGHTRQCLREVFDAPKDKSFLMRRAMEAVEQCISSLPAAQRTRLAGIGVSAPGMIDRAEGVVRRSVNIQGFRDVPVVAEFQARFRAPVALEEASRAMALAETWFGNGSRRRDFICLDLGYGVGMGIVHDGLPYRGANEISGEIGHTIVRPGGARCTCGKRGCLETVASGKALAEAAKKLPLKELGISERGARAVSEAARAGNEDARRILVEAGRAIGVAIANVVNLFDPEQVILNGGLTKSGPVLIDAIRRTAADHMIHPRGRRCPIELSGLGDSAGALGAAMLPMRSYFEFDNIRL